MNTKIDRHNQQLEEIQHGLEAGTHEYDAKLRLGEMALGQQWLYYIDRRELLGKKLLLDVDKPVEGSSASGRGPHEDNGFKLSDSEIFDNLNRCIEEKRDLIIFALTDVLERSSHLRGLVDNDQLPPFIKSQLMGDGKVKPGRAEMRNLLADWLESSDQTERHQRLELLLHWYTDYFELIQPTQEAQDELNRRADAAKIRSGGLDLNAHARVVQEHGRTALEVARRNYLQAVTVSLEEGWQSYGVTGFMQKSNKLQNIRVRHGDNFVLDDKNIAGYVHREVGDQMVTTHPLDAGFYYEHTYFHEMNHLTGSTKARWLDEALTEHRALLLLDRVGGAQPRASRRDVEHVSPMNDHYVRGGSYPFSRHILSMMIELCRGQVKVQELTLAHTADDEEMMEDVMVRINNVLGTKDFVQDIETEIIKHQLAMQGLSSETDEAFVPTKDFDEAAAKVAQRLAKVVAVERMISVPKK